MNFDSDLNVEEQGEQELVVYGDELWLTLKCWGSRWIGTRCIWRWTLTHIETLRNKMNRNSLNMKNFDSHWNVEEQGEQELVVYGHGDELWLVELRRGFTNDDAESNAPHQKSHLHCSEMGTFENIYYHLF